MEHPHDSTLEKSGDSVNSKFKNSRNTTSNIKIGGKTKPKNATKFSPSHKSFKYSQNNTIQKWITKDLSGYNNDTSSNQSCSKMKNKKELSIYDIDDNETCSSNEGQSSERDNVKKKENHCIKKSKKKREKSRRDSSPGLHVKEFNNVKESKERSSKSKNKKKSRALQEVDLSDVEMTCNENMARKKFKKIVTKPISLTTLADVKLNVNPTKSSKSSQHCTSSSSSSKKDNIKQNTTVIPTKQYKSPQRASSSVKSTKPTPVIATRVLFDMFSQSDGINDLLKKCTGKRELEPEYNEISLKSTTFNKMDESSKHCPDKDYKKTNNSTSEINLKKPTQDVTAVTSKQKKIPLNSKSRKHNADTSGRTCSQSNNKQPTWLTKDTKKKNQHVKRSDKSSNQSNESHGSDSKEEHNKGRSKGKKKKMAVKTLDNFLSKNPKEEFSRSESNENCEYPSFAKNKKKLKANRVSDSFKKYGVTVPSVEEILREQKDLAQYKNQIESFKDIDDKFFELPFSVKDLKNKRVVDENILDCKHLTYQDIEEAFHDNLNYISGIFHGRRYSERHERFFEANLRNYAFTVKDLCYNTSTIVFSFEQNEQMLALLKREFDPEDKKTLYFFQVLLPELCLKIFMDTHNMMYSQAVKYLDTRPIVD